MRAYGGADIQVVGDIAVSTSYDFEDFRSRQHSMCSFLVDVHGGDWKAGLMSCQAWLRRRTGRHVRDI